MTTQFIPSDIAARQKISEKLDETLFVEASAGTGKTTSLVQRVVNLVASGRATIGSIAAITFTEAAAAELRDRPRQELEKPPMTNPAAKQSDFVAAKPPTVWAKPTSRPFILSHQPCSTSARWKPGCRPDSRLPTP